MHERDCHAAFADARSDALDRSVTYVPGCEDPRDARLEQKRIALTRPSCRRALPQQIHHVATRADVAPLIPNHIGGKPRRLGVCADEDEKRVTRAPLPLLRSAADRPRSSRADRRRLPARPPSRSRSRRSPSSRVGRSSIATCSPPAMVLARASSPIRRSSRTATPLVRQNFRRRSDEPCGREGPSASVARRTVVHPSLGKVAPCRARRGGAIVHRSRLRWLVQ